MLLKRAAAAPRVTLQQVACPPTLGQRSRSRHAGLQGLCEAFAVSGRTHGHVPMDTST